MDQPDEAKLDWIHLSPGVQPLSLWDCLHDAYLQRIHSDLMAQSVVLELESPHLQGWRGLPDDVLFRILLTGVASVRAVTSVPWPGPAPDLTGKSIAEQNLLVEAYQANWREESVNWTDFEAALAAGDFSFYILDAELVQDTRAATLRLGGMLHGSRWHGLVIRAAQLSVSRSDGEPFSLDELMAHGEDYWNAFDERSAQRQAES